MKSLAAVVILAGLLAACSKGPSDEGAPTKVPVEVAKAQAGFGRDILTAYGTVEASPDGVRTLAAPFDGVVTAIPAAVGDRVAAGASVVVLTPLPAVEASVRKAAKDLAGAQAQAAQAQRLYDGNLATNADLASANQALAAAQATADDLRRRVGQGGAHRMTAPASGVVLSLSAQPGAQVAAGAPLAAIGNAGAIQASIGLPPEQAIRVGRGDVATVTVLGGAKVLSGRVSRVSGQLDPQTRLAPVMIALPANAATLGTAIEAQVAVGASHPIVWVPHTAIAADGAEPAVFVVENGIAHRRTVRLGQEDGDRVAVLSGVPAGAVVVTTGAGTLDDGAAVVAAKAAR